MSQLNYPLVTHLSSTEYLNYETPKFSKSQGIGVFGNQVITISKTLGIDEDYWRDYLLKIRPETSDSSFNLTEFVSVIKSDLAQKLGSFIHRCVVLVDQYYGHQCFIQYNISNIQEKASLLSIINNYRNNILNFHYREAIKNINELTHLGNSYLNVHSIWKLCQDDPIKHELIMGNCLFIIYCLAELLDPIIPRKANTIKSYITVQSDTTILTVY